MSLNQVINKQDIIQTTDECVMCGLCLPHCPTYKLAQFEPESPRGRIALVRALYEEQLGPSHSLQLHLEHCLTCMNCERVCPANVDYEKIIDAGRAATSEQQNLFNRIQKTFLLFFLSNTTVRYFLKKLIVSFRTLKLQQLLSKVRLFSLIPDNTPQYSTAINFNCEGPRVTVINSCAADLVKDETQSAAESLLSKLGCQVVKEKQTYCCGALHQHNGELETAKQLRKKFFSIYQNHNLDFICSTATGCGAHIDRHKNDNLKHLDITQLVLQQLEKKQLSFRPILQKVLIHIPCTQQQLIDTKSVEYLLKYIPEIELMYFMDEQICCGAGGMNALTQPKLASQLIKNKIEKIKHSNAAYLVSSNIGCALHFQSQLKQNNINVRVCHPVTLLAQQML